MSPISEEIDEFWKQVGKEEGMRLLPREDRSAFLSKLGEESASIGRPKLEPWVSILEIGILGLTHLYLSLQNAMDQHPSDRLRVPWSLTGFACSQAVAIHCLSLSGLDPAAKSSLRTFSKPFMYWLCA